jgi:hypothetical protein
LVVVPGDFILPSLAHGPLCQNDQNENKEQRPVTEDVFEPARQQGPLAVKALVGNRTDRLAASLAGDRRHRASPPSL